MGKKIFGIYLAKLDAPNSEAHARLELPASPWELHDAMDKVQLQEMCIRDSQQKSADSFGLGRLEQDLSQFHFFLQIVIRDFALGEKLDRKSVV